jgi:SAM-dependent methyltransferase
MKNQEDGKPIAVHAYEALAERYAALVDTKAHNADYERPATLSLVPSIEGKRVLDAGCGPGVYAEWLVDHGAQVTAIDASPKMVEFARQRLGARADVRLADLGKPLDFLGDESFDLVLSPLVLDYIKDWTSVLGEFYRLLRALGLLVFSVEHPFEKFKQSVEGNYFATELVHYTWRGFGGESVEMPSYRRPLSAMIASLWETGFVVEQVVEPRPTEAFKDKDPEDYEKLSKQPGFLCVRARKAGRRGA